MFPVAKCETCFSGDMGQGKQTSLKFKTKDFFALGIPAAAAVDTHISGYVIHNL